jgi:predicted small metal-binding protein
MDCRKVPSASDCSLTISGEENEVMKAATEHAVAVHGERDTPEFRETLRKSLEPARD